MQNSGFTAMMTDCGVTPQAQNTGISSSPIGTGSPQSGLAMFLIPIASGLARWTGAPWTDGNRVVICTARMASAAFIGRIETTSGPWNGPAGTVSIEVRYIGTVQLQVKGRSSMPSSINACSNENEQPIAKVTRSSRHQRIRSGGSDNGAV